MLSPSDSQTNPVILSRDGIGGRGGNRLRSYLRLEKLQPDIVVMDIRMPGLDGIAAAREIKAKYPHVKIIGLSEYAYGYNTDAMEKAGAVGVIKNPRLLKNSIR
ncbi:MAG TPA: response regulator transcription factor [Anaerolineales bacterium]